MNCSIASFVDFDSMGKTLLRQTFNRCVAVAIFHSMLMWQYIYEWQKEKRRRKKKKKTVTLANPTEEQKKFSAAERGSRVENEKKKGN